MTFDERDLSRALAGLRDAVRRQSGPAPAAGALRRRAERQRRVRRAATTLAAAAAVIAVAAGGMTVVRGEASPPPRPADPTTAPPTPGPTPTPTPSGAPPTTPTAPPAVDPITRVNWARSTVTMPRHDGCPDGEVRLSADPATANQPEALLIGRSPRSNVELVVERRAFRYGDLTGDGRAEAAVTATCVDRDGEDSGDGQGQLLVIQRSPAGRLTAIGWVGPRGGIFSDWWITQSVLHTDVKPWHTDWGYALGEVRGYRLAGDAFVEVDTTEAYPGLVPAGGRPGVVADLTPIAGDVACRDGDLPRRDAVLLSLGPDGTGEAGGTTWDANQPMAPDSIPHVLDLDADGRRRLVVALYCGGGNAETGPANVVVLERSGRGYRAVAVLVPERGPRMHEWRYERGTLTLYLGEGASEAPYRWTGRGFDPLFTSPPARAGMSPR